MAEATLLERLRVSELLSAEQIAELEPLPEAANPDPKALARVVFQRGWLTRFQLSQIAAGKGKDLFVGPYVMLDRLGEGGMGQVLKARHRHMKRVVALKLIRKEKLGGADSVARFYQEVEAAAQLHHPNIVMAFDAGQAGGTHYFAMEYVEGPDLTRLVREKGTLPVAQACEFIRQAAVGLQHAHERGLVHRDIKPSNLLVTASAAEPVVKILDLGLARLGDTFAKERNLTKMGQVIGTPDYLAPEQALDARNVDIRADIYSLGCSLYFLLAARAPFQAESLTELLMKHQMDEAAPIRSLRPDVPPALEAVLRRMMAKKAQDRPATPAEVAAALEPFARGESVGESARSAVSIAAPPPVRGDETWAGLSNDAEVVARPKTRASRSRDTIDEEPRPRRKKEKGNKGLLIGGAVGAGALLLALIIGGVALFSPKKPAKVVENKPPAQGTQVQPVPPPEVVPPVQPKEDPPADDALAAIDRGVREGKMTRTRMVGGGSGNEEYADLGPTGAWLTGLEVGTGKWNDQDVVYYLRPIYQSQSPRRRDLGKMFGTHRVPHNLEAKPGYAVGGITINAGSGLDGLSITFMAIKGAALDPADSYSSYWVGGKGGVARTLGGDGRPIVGIFGKLAEQPPVSNGLGLVMLSNGRPAPVTPAGDPERLIGGGFGGEVYRDLAPEGGLLVGVEVGLGKFGKNDVTQSLRPIFRTGDKETKGPQRGTKIDPVKTLLAEPGYAVGAMSVRYGANADGLSLTFMRIKGDALDPADFKESEWVGDPRPRQPKTLLSGGGRPVVGLAIKAKPQVVTGYGLILRPGAAPAPGALAGEVRQFPLTAGRPLRGLFFHFDGKRGTAYFDPIGVTLDPTTGQQADFYRINSNRVRSMTASRDGKRILIADDKNRIRLMDLENGKEVQALEMAADAAPTVRVAMSADGKHALTVPSNDGSLLLWDLQTGKLEHKFEGLGQPIRSCAITDDGQYVIAGHDGRKLLAVWEVKSKRMMRSPVLPGITLCAHRLVAPVGGSEVLVCGEDGIFAVLDCATGKEVRNFGPPASRYRSALVVSADRKTAVTIGGYDGNAGSEPVSREREMQVWDIVKGAKIATVELSTTPRFVAVSPDGKSALVADEKIIHYFDLTKLAPGAGAKSPAPPAAAAGAELRRFPGLGYALGYALGFLQDGKTGRAFAGTAAYTLDPATGKRTEAFSVAGAATLAQTMSKDCKYVLRGDADGRLRLIDFGTGKLVKSAGDTKHQTRPQAVALSPDLKLALSCPDGYLFENGKPVLGPDGKWSNVAACDVCLWDLDTGKLEHRFAGSNSPTRACAFTDDGKYVVACNPSIPLRIWELKTKKLVHTISGAGLGSRANLLFPVRGSEMLVGCNDGSFLLYDCASGKEIRRFANTPPHAHHAIVGTADNKTALTLAMALGKIDGKRGLKDATIHLWDVAKGVEVARVHLPTQPLCVAISPDGKFAMVSEAKVIRYLDLEKIGRGDGTKPAVVDLRPPAAEPPPVPAPPVAPPKSDAVQFVGHTGPVNGVALSPDGTQLLSGGEDGSVRLWDPATRKPLRTLRAANANQGSILAVRFTPNGKTILALDDRRRASHWQTKSGQWTGSSDVGFRLPSGDAPGFDVSTTSDFLAVPAGKTLVLMRVGSDQLIRERTQALTAAGTSVASVGEGDVFAVGDSAGAVRLADLTSRKPTLGLPMVPHKEAVLALVYNPKGKHLFSGSADKTIKRTPLRPGTKPVPRAFARHDDAVTCLAVSRDGKRLASGSKDKTVRVWDATTMKELHKFTGDAAIRDVAFSADGKTVYSAGKTLRAWALADAKKE